MAKLSRERETESNLPCPASLPKCLQKASAGWARPKSGAQSAYPASRWIKSGTAPMDTIRATSAHIGSRYCRQWLNTLCPSPQLPSQVPPARRQRLLQCCPCQPYGKLGFLAVASSLLWAFGSEAATERPVLSLSLPFKLIVKMLNFVLLIFSPQNATCDMY